MGGHHVRSNGHTDFCCDDHDAGDGVRPAQEPSKLPDWSGQWTRTYGGNPRYDPTKPIRKQEAPLTPEYQALFEASIKDQDLGGHGLDPGYSCLPQGMPRMMSGVSPFEFLFTPGITYMLFERTDFAPRRIYTDGRGWPDTEDTWFHGYSIGKWIDTDGDGRFDTLEVETRHIRGPRVWDQSGMPMAADNQTVITERISLDKKGLLRVEMTTVDNSLTRPWTVLKTFRRQARGLVGPRRLRRGPGPRHHRQGGLFPQWRRHHHADEEGPAAAGFEVFQSGQEVADDAQCCAMEIMG